MLIRSFRTQLTALYLAFFSLLFVLFSIFLYGELSRSLVARLDDTLAAEADTAAVLFPDELQEMKGDAPAAAREVIGELKVHGDFVTIGEGTHWQALGGARQAQRPQHDVLRMRDLFSAARSLDLLAERVARQKQRDKRIAT